MKWIVSLAFLLFCTYTIAHADTCPSVANIKANRINGWKAFDSDDGKPLSKKRSIAFAKAAEHFILAEWSNRGKAGAAIHCFYRDKNGSDLEAYLTKSNLAPEQMKTWYQVSGAMQCAANNDMCQFSHIGTQPKLAEK